MILAPSAPPGPTQKKKEPQEILSFPQLRCPGVISPRGYLSQPPLDSARAQSGVRSPYRVSRLGILARSRQPSLLTADTPPWLGSGHSRAPRRPGLGGRARVQPFGLLGRGPRAQARGDVHMTIGTQSARGDKIMVAPEQFFTPRAARRAPRPKSGSLWAGLGRALSVIGRGERPVCRCALPLAGGI